MGSTERFTGKGREYSTKKRVKYADRLAGILITLGGLGTILAVTLVFVFLAWVVVPLFGSAEISSLRKLDQVRPAQGGGILAVDEYLVAGWLLTDGGENIRSLRLADGSVLNERPLFDGLQPQALAFDPREELVSAAFDDGTIRLINIGFSSSFLHDPSQLPDAVRALTEGQEAVYDGGIVQRTPEGQLRHQILKISPQEPIDVGVTDIHLIDVTQRNNGPVIATLGRDNTLRVQSSISRRNLLTGKVTTDLNGGELKLPGRADGSQPSFLMLSGIADTVYVIWEDGYLIRVDARDITSPVIAEELDLLEEADARLTAATFLIGKTTLVTGDSKGRVQSWFRIKPDGADTVDASLLVKTHDLGQGSAAVTSLVPSFRTRLLGAGFADGTVRINHVTSDQVLSEEKVGEGGVSALALSPKDDAFAALTDSGLSLWTMNVGHPSATLKTLFTKVHYEGMTEPAHIWQSSSGTDTFEPKFGLIPLIFGTLKATFYTMIFAVPLALLAAIYTSEFLNVKLRARIKPIVEMMASLPSVVLGFLAALVVAPFVEDIVPAVLASFFTLPLAFVMAAYIFQLLPSHLYVRWSRWRFYLLFFLALPVGVLLAKVTGPIIEQMLFNGDIKAWLNGRVGTGASGWMLMLLPISGIVAATFISKVVSPRMRDFTVQLNRRSAGYLEIGKFIGGLILTLVLTWLAAMLLNAAGLDSRMEFPLIGPMLDTYVQRNALVVGVMMGFAVIPIIYTLAEDALSSVPEHLRAASLACGATPWQTAVRIIVPTAASGLFSAVMVGLGRAVGETMIVLMAAGNTPVLEMNIFNGFRTLAANIAVELPEAVIYSTHFRVLFLAALTLFLMTFVVNTLAEVIRLRFRKRAYQL